MPDPETVSAADLLGELPPVTPANATPAPAAAVTDQGAATAPASPLPSFGPPPETDAKGTPFDPAKHVRAKHSRTGCWMPRRQPAAGRAESAAPASGSFVAPDAPAAPPPAPADQFEAAGAAATAALIAVGVTAFGDEWIPRKGEPENLQGAFAAYFRAKGVADVPPGLALAIAVLGYAGPRFTQPETLTRLQKFKLWLASLRARRAAVNLASHMPNVPSP